MIAQRMAGALAAGVRRAFRSIERQPRRIADALDPYAEPTRALPGETRPT